MALAFKVGVDRRTISRLENGQNAPRDDTLINLANFLCAASAHADFIVLGRRAQAEEEVAARGKAGAHGTATPGQ